MSLVVKKRGKKHANSTQKAKIREEEDELI
jgi:hypothetical protein